MAAGRVPSRVTSASQTTASQDFPTWASVSGLPTRSAALRLSVANQPYLGKRTKALLFLVSIHRSSLTESAADLDILVLEYASGLGRPNVLIVRLLGAEILRH